MVNLFATRDARLRTLKILNDIEENLSGYLVVVTAINLGLGVVTTIMAYALGLPSPLLWGALAFTLNYIPYIGPGIMYVILFAIGLVDLSDVVGRPAPARHLHAGNARSRVSSSRRPSSGARC